MSDDNVIEIVPHEAIPPSLPGGPGAVDILSPDSVGPAPTAAPAKVAPTEEKEKPLREPPEPRNPDLELLEALRKERDKERAEKAKAQQDRAQIERVALSHIQQERQRAAQAERELQTRTGQAVRAHWQAVTSDLSQITNAIASTKLEIETAKRDLALASEASDHQKAADAQERIALAATDLRALEHGQSGASARVEEAKRAIEAMAAAASRQQAQPQQRPQQQRPQQPQQPQRPQQQQAQPQQQQPATAEQWIANCPPATQPWLKANADYVTDPKLNRKLLRFADEWMDDNGAESLNTESFVRALKQRFETQEASAKASGGATEDGDVIEIDPNDKAPSMVKRQISAPAASAPVSRPATPGSPRSTMRVRLSPEQMAIAPQIYPRHPETGKDLTPAESRAFYAADLLKAQQEGKFASRE